MESVLRRGYAIVRGDNSVPVTSPKGIKSGQGLTVQFAGDETLTVVASQSVAKAPARPKKPAGNDDQEDLFS